MNDAIRGLPVALAFVGILSASCGACAGAPGPFANVPPLTDCYMNDVDRLYADRPGKPYCTARGCEGFRPAVTDLGTGRP